MITILDVADYFLNRVDRMAGSYITPLKLQKLTYYAQAWSLVWDGQQLFNDEFEAWAHGPANPKLYRKYNLYKSNPIPKPKNATTSIFTKTQLDTLEAVWNAYGIYDAKYLEELTHQERPWLNARIGVAPGERCSNIISRKSMKEFYSKF